MAFPSMLKKRYVIFFMLAWMCFLGCIPQNASSMPVGSGIDTSPDGLNREAYIKTIENALSQGSVKRQLERFGIKENVLRMRLAGLQDNELRDLALRADQLKAGGSAGAVVAIILIVALIALIIYIFNTHDIEIRRKAG